ncbi:MAG TPA: ATP-binding protein [Nitrospiria bacterium]|nr:ATP-binding protein [Nitrospiria bacterium]
MKELHDQRLQRIERHEGQLWLMAVLVIIAFTITMFVKHAAELIESPDYFSLESMTYLLGLPLISSLFCAYVLQSSNRLRTIKGQLFVTMQEKTQIQTLLEEVKAQSSELLALNKQLETEISDREQAEARLVQANEKLVNRESKLLYVLQQLRQSHDELKAAQRQLIQAAKLESVGRLAAGVAHEVKNPLATILLGTQYLTSQLATDNVTIRDVLQDMSKAVKKADSVIIALMDYSVSQAVTFTAQDFNPIIEQALVLLKYELDKYHIAVKTSMDLSLPQLKLDRRKIEQALVNLFLNAIQAMTNGGTLTVTTSVVPADRTLHALGSDATKRFAAGDSLVLVEIEDTGSGIPENYLPSIYDPFFTGRPPGKGIGMGLTVTRNIIERHGGVIHIQNLDTAGARVVIALRI